MIKIVPGMFININTQQAYDSTGQPEMQITVEGNYELITMQQDLTNIRAEFDSYIFQLQQKEFEEQELRKNTPALKELYDQYKTVLALVKDNNNAK